ncbi:Spy/CpxP family protein refolding chaperone [Waterburya agarophytonicola K14]|uniref:Spy/CpxP family protein refolding chaperone n=1 Tax=Waterburya agarophytonicola KI4 TaxID=2874699 RepID=A0A964BRM5_9CYAN|nr:Spy/CpxP family protein refolding chaperone [Waterburya agarophytonicola]MCC0177032.1 Spy/CpxP family protein refolding chaperone [Waterburya agarophytonicola KI4]
MVTTRWQGLLSITATTVVLILIIHISPAIAHSKISFPRQNNDFHFQKSSAIADNSLTTVKQQHSSSLLNQLNLTNQQKDRIKQIHQQYKQQILKKKNNLTILQQQLSDLMVGTESVELIRAKNQQLITLRQEIGELRFESMLATREILTPQQRQKFREIIESQVAQ